jgi:hypothetical protein
MSALGQKQTFWVGFNDQNDCNCRNRWSNSVAGEAWYRRMEAAMRVRLGRKPVHDEYNRDDGDSLKQIASFRRVAEELRGNRAKIVGLLKERAWHLAAPGCGQATPSLGPGRHHLYEVDLLRAFATISP